MVEPGAWPSGSISSLDDHREEPCVS